MQIREQYPWDIPVPVRESEFIPVFSKHTKCNLEVAMERIGSFGVRRQPISPDQLILVDQQANLFSHVNGRMGSGRSGAYQDFYLKGVGRTPLACNWNSDDHIHNSGHLTASSAIREYVISVYIKIFGGENSIVPCQGVLLRPLSTELSQLRGFLLKDFSEEALPVVDGAIQAISVKSSAFARISNFSWCLHHLTPRYSQEMRNCLSWFSRALFAALSEPFCGYGFDCQKITPNAIAERLESAVVRACNNFKLWLKLGIWWGSFGNNFTMDGRFLDLETPGVSGGLFLGRLSSEGVLGGRIQKSSVIGTEIYYYISQMIYFCRTAMRVLFSLPSSFHSVERDFAGALAREIELRFFKGSSIINSKVKAVDLTLGFYADILPSLSAAAVAKLREILELEYDRIIGGSASSAYLKGIEDTVPLEIPPIISEAGVKWEFRALRLSKYEAVIPTSRAQVLASRLHALIAELDAVTDLDELLSKLADVEGRIQALVDSVGCTSTVKQSATGGVLD